MIELRTQLFADLESPDGVRTGLQNAIRLEHATIPPYLYALYSLLPGVNDEIRRHARIRIDYRDIHGNPQTEESDGLRAVCHQHEIDQLNGMFWIQRLSRLKRERLIKRFEKGLRG